MEPEQPSPSPEVPAEPEPLPDREDVIFDVLAVCIAIGLVLLAIAVRANMKRERLRNMAKKKGSAEVRERVAPAKADLEAVEALAGVEGLTAAAALEAIASTRCMERLAGRHKKLKLQAIYHALEQLPPAMWGALERTTEPSAGQSLLLLLYQMYNEAELLRGVELDERTAAAHTEAVALGVQLAVHAFEHACKAGTGPIAQTLGRLVACLRLGLWSWDDAPAVALMRQRLKAQDAPYPKIKLSATAKSWMGMPVISPSTTVSVMIKLEREHAGESGATHQRLGWRGGQPVPIYEAYTCLLTRDTDSSGGKAGTVVALVEIEVDDLTRGTATVEYKLTAPKTPGEYKMRIHCLSLEVLGIDADAEAAFTVASADEMGAMEQQNDDYD